MLTQVRFFFKTTGRRAAFVVVLGLVLVLVVPALRDEYTDDIVSSALLTGGALLCATSLIVYEQVGTNVYKRSLLELFVTISVHFFMTCCLSKTQKKHTPDGNNSCGVMSTMPQPLSYAPSLP